MEVLDVYVCSAASDDSERSVCVVWFLFRLVSEIIGDQRVFP